MRMVFGFQWQPRYNCTKMQKSNAKNGRHTVCPKIFAEIYFAGLMKLLHLAEFTLVVGKPYAIMIFIAKWLIRNGQELDCNDDELWLWSTHGIV